MSAYIAQLNAAVAREQAERQEKERIATQAVRERLTPLEGGLYSAKASVLASSFAQGPLARSRSPGELGMALRKLGFTRQRDGTAPRYPIQPIRECISPYARNSIARRFD
jgi:hypothetical protein